MNRWKTPEIQELCQSLFGMNREELPSETHLSPAHIGKIGEALFGAMYNPPAPLPEFVREICSEEAPEWVDIEGLSIRSFVEAGHYFSVKKDGEEIRWERDAIISASHTPTSEERQTADKSLPMGWTKQFPIEIKTGPEATTRNGQREVMQFLAENTEYTPLLVRLSIESLPEAFSVTEIEVFD